MRMTWQQLYSQHYVPTCQKQDIIPYTFGNFCHIRATQRSYYQQSRKVGKTVLCYTMFEYIFALVFMKVVKTSWNHVECNECVLLQHAIAKAKTKGERDKSQVLLEEHWERQGAFRLNYEVAITKVVSRFFIVCVLIILLFHEQTLMSENDICMHVDGAGVVGMKHSPRYPETLTSDALPHMCLRLKNTFAKVHGLGRIVYQSYPLLEKQGANLIVECILRSIVTYMEEKEMKSLRNVNVFLDNTSVNKCHTILAAMSCLVLLGMMFNVKLLINVALTIFSLSCVTTSFA